MIKKGLKRIKCGREYFYEIDEYIYFLKMKKR
jgi:hypothetical protein